MIGLVRNSDRRVPSHFLIDQAVEGTMQNRRCFCDPDFATVKSSAWTCQSNENILSLDLVEKDHFDDEVMMELMRSSDSRVPSHFLMDQTMEGTMQNRRCVCNPDVATVKSSAWTCQPNEQALSLDLVEK